MAFFKNVLLVGKLYTQAIAESDTPTSSSWETYKLDLFNF